jgi:NAD(P)-dependent dehydrogenase (short-subunit alcohol dehydrogenase family)
VSGRCSSGGCVSGHDPVNTKPQWVNVEGERRRNFVINNYVMTMQDKKIVVAGGTSGIGLATAQRFHQLGGIVTVTGRQAQRLRAAEGLGLNTAAVDSRDRKALDAFFAAQGAVDHLVVAVSGGKGMGEFAKLALSELREGFEEKFWPQLETVQSALPYIQPGGSVTLITAISATAKLPGVSGLAAVNGALELMVAIWARELRTIRVNAVSPGVIDTPWWDFVPRENRQAAFAQYTAGLPVSRAGRPEEVAEAIVLLAGNGYITGKVLGVDGGMA